ncbi:TPA: hypothetical protein RUY31_003623 [Klebsiella quasipneumoniae subsp. similipneumoniae]|nr:hypothetical protein [Klebsiella quasipneumoniae subsp. similipneumoniae]
MDSLKQRMLDFIRQNQPVTELQLTEGLGISRNACRENRRQLRAVGLIYISCGSGAFLSLEDFQKWLEHGGGHEKISMTAKKGIHNAVDNSARKRVIEYLSEQTEPVGAGEIAKACNLINKTAYRVLATLADDGTVIHDGRVKGRQYLIASSDVQWPANGEKSSERKVKAFAKYNPKKNGVVQAYLNSPARQRLMAVYGRMG